MNNPITCYYSNNDYGDKNMLVPMKVDYVVRILVHLASLQPDAIEKATEISMASPIPEIKEIYTDVWANGGSEWHN